MTAAVIGGTRAYVACSVDGCETQKVSKGLCPMHRRRQRLFGSVHYVRPPETLEQTAARFWPRVAKGEGCWIWQGRYKPAGYGEFTWKGMEFGAHRVAYQLAFGPIPEGMVVDHLCHNPACVKPEHFRLATTKQNAENRSGANRHSASGIRGVSKTREGKWIGQVTHNYVRHAQTFDAIEDAAAYVAAKRKELYTPVATGGTA